MKSKYQITVHSRPIPATWDGEKIIVRYELMYSIERVVKQGKHPSDSLCLICIEYPGGELRVPYLTPKKYSPHRCRYLISGRRTIMSKAYALKVLEYFGFVPSELLFSNDKAIRELAKFLLDENNELERDRKQ